MIAKLKQKKKLLGINYVLEVNQIFSLRAILNRICIHVSRKKKQVLTCSFDWEWANWRLTLAIKSINRSGCADLVPVFIETCHLDSIHRSRKTNALCDNLIATAEGCVILRLLLDSLQVMFWFQSCVVFW